MKKVRQMFLAVNEDRRSQSVGEESINRENNQSIDSISHYQVHSRYSRIDFPNYNGDDVYGWVYFCEQCFGIDDTPLDIESEVSCNSFRREGTAITSYVSQVRIL